MTAPHPLDRPIWTALTTGWAPLAQSGAAALRLDAEHGPFLAAADGSPKSRAALAGLVDDDSWVVEEAPYDPPPGTEAVRSAALLQMVAERPAVDEPFDFVELGDGDAAEMRALALLTQPGPYRALTHRFGGFIGVRREGRLVAMAGQRMKAGRFTEVSGVCTHPDCRGQGYAGRLMRTVARRIVARGETPFLHVYPENRGAIALYEALGYVGRIERVVTVLRRV